MAAKYCHLLTVTTIGSATGDLALHHTELLGEGALQTGGVKTCEGCHLTGLQTRVQQGYQTSEVSGVEDNHHVLHVGTELLNVLTELLSDLTVAGEQILTGHTSLTGRTT